MSNKRRCKNCLFGDICPKTHVCDDYAPVKESDWYVGKLIDTGRKEFLEDWGKYINEYAD